MVVLILLIIIFRDVTSSSSLHKFYLRSCLEAYSGNGIAFESAELPGAYIVSVNNNLDLEYYDSARKPNKFAENSCFGLWYAGNDTSLVVMRPQDRSKVVEVKNSGEVVTKNAQYVVGTRFRLEPYDGMV